MDWTWSVDHGELVAVIVVTKETDNNDMEIFITWIIKHRHLAILSLFSCFIQNWGITVIWSLC